MADDRYHWLDKDAAERLLRGEPVGSPQDAGAAELVGLLRAAASPEAAGPGPLPGEEAAVAAFRQAHGAASEGARTPVGEAAAPEPPLVTVRTARPPRPTLGSRLGRPFRRGLAVALAACALGGVAVAAGTGVLTVPFQSSPEPATSVTAVGTPGPYGDQPGDGQRPADASPSGEPTPTAPGTTKPSGPTGGPTDRDGDGQDPARNGAGGQDGGDGADGDDGDDRKDGGRNGAGDGAPDGKGRGKDKGKDKGEKGREGDGPGREGRRFLRGLCREYESDRRSAMARELLRRLEREAGSRGIHAFCRQYEAHASRPDHAGGGKEHGRDGAGWGRPGYVGGRDDQGAGWGRDQPGPRPGEHGAGGRDHGGRGHGGGHGRGEERGRQHARGAVPAPLLTLAREVPVVSGAVS
ncbi:hypothetical protein [Streptomyces sp. NPDC003077]|uniref:hypothetical protein n=1 Tax=Streptomyces sp. NPDC003077 TaxID=3154443 RepID=UPI0033A56058